MRRSLKGFIILVIILGIAYMLVFSVERIGEGKRGVVEDLRTKQIVRVIQPLVRGYAFVWHASFPCWFSYSETQTERIARYDIKIAIPGLDNLREDYYRLIVPLQAEYRIDWQKFSDISKLADNGRELDDTVRTYFEIALKKEMQAYLHPAYQREMLALQINAITERSRKEVESEIKPLGLTLVNAAVIGGVSLPDRALYNEGMLHAADLRKTDRTIEKGLMEIRSGMDREKIKNEILYGKLREISKIIKNNPDILKYIYIDKLGGNVKVILSSDTTGLPNLLEEARIPKKGKSGDVDNLK
jgi:hypothetical protein